MLPGALLGQDNPDGSGALDIHPWVRAGKVGGNCVRGGITCRRGAGSKPLTW